VRKDFLFLSRRETYGGRMTISTLVLILLLTFGAASALDCFMRSHRLHEALASTRLWGRDTGWERTRY
jgi:hypothetical protein